MGHAQNKKPFFSQKQQKQILSFQNIFILTKYHVFWLSYECFSILCNTFLLKSAISSHNSCALANIFALEEKLPDESFQQIRNSNGKKLTPALIIFQANVCLLRANVCFLPLKMLEKTTNRLPDMPFGKNLKMRFLHHALSKALTKSKKTLVTLNPSSNYLGNA